MTALESLRRRAEAYLKEDPRVRRWRVRTDGAIALEIIAQGSVPPNDRYQIIESLGRMLFRVDRPEGALDALLEDLVVVRVDVDGIQMEPPPLDPGERLQAINHQFWVDLWVAYGFLQRGKPWKAIKQMADLRELIFEVARLAADDSAQRDEEGIPNALKGAFAQTCCKPEPQPIGQALLFMIYVYLQIRRGASHRLQMVFNENTEAGLIAHLNQAFGQINVEEI